MSLPAFRYHPDPLATGSVIRSDARCVCCGDARGYVYAGPVYAVDEYENCLCPRCIADDSAQPSLARTASAAANGTKCPTRSSAKSLVVRRAFRVGSRSGSERIAAMPRSSSAVRVPENCARSARRQSRRFGNRPDSTRARSGSVALPHSTRTVHRPRICSAVSVAANPAATRIAFDGLAHGIARRSPVLSS